ncbi:MAG TPA: hypothetical protein DCF63_10960, partial [Planctomycetaceae bacterium]|nr:hypothetical protein [Planctomycetaceae bacterium]
MPRHTNTSSNQSRRQTGWIWAIIFLVNAVVVVDSWKHHNRIVKCCDASMRQAALKIDRHSNTGYELGMRRLILPLQAIDGLHWIMHAQSMLRDSKWRVRSTTGDNFPQGRDVHWSHGFLWSLMAFATVHGWLADLPVAASVEAVAPYVNTFFLVIAIVVCPWMLRRRLGNLGAVGLSCSMIGVHSFYQLFMVGYIDHHGAIAMASLFCVLLVAAGGAGWTVATPSDELLFRESRLVTPKKRSNRRSGGTALSKAGQNIE